MCLFTYLPLLTPIVSRPKYGFKLLLQSLTQSYHYYCIQFDFYVVSSRGWRGVEKDVYNYELYGKIANAIKIQ